MTAQGHEEWFPPSNLSDGFGLRKETVAGRRRNGRDAPKAVVALFRYKLACATDLRNPHSWAKFDAGPAAYAALRELRAERRYGEKWLKSIDAMCSAH
jgi:hypothetical protein